MEAARDPLDPTRTLSEGGAPEHRAALGIDCPKCGAKAGAWCPMPGTTWNLCGVRIHVGHAMSPKEFAFLDEEGRPSLAERAEVRAAEMRKDLADYDARPPCPLTSEALARVNKITARRGIRVDAGYVIEAHRRTSSQSSLSRPYLAARDLAVTDPAPVWTSILLTAIRSVCDAFKGGHLTPDEEREIAGWMRLQAIGQGAKSETAP